MQNSPVQSSAFNLGHSSIAPAAANLEPGYTGMTMREAMGILHGMRGLDVIGGDVVCLIPTKDNPNNITSQHAMVVMFEILSLIADRMPVKPAA